MWSTYSILSLYNTTSSHFSGIVGISNKLFKRNWVPAYANYSNCQPPSHWDEVSTWCTCCNTTWTLVYSSIFKQQAPHTLQTWSLVWIIKCPRLVLFSKPTLHCFAPPPLSLQDLSSWQPHVCRISFGRPGRKRISTSLTTLRLSHLELTQLANAMGWCGMDTPCLGHVNDSQQRSRSRS